MLDHFHFRHEIGNFDEVFGSVATGQDDMRHRRFFLFQERDHIRQRDIVIAKRDIDFIEQHHRDAFVTDQLPGFLPGRSSHFDVAFLVLGFPGKPFAHRVEFAQIGKALDDQIALARCHPALDELDDCTFLAMRNVPEDHAESSGRFALALAGVNDDQALFVGLGGHDLVARRLLLGHLGIVAGGVGCFGHESLAFWPS